MKKFFLILFLCIITIPLTSYADDNLEDEIEIDLKTIETSSNIEEIPEINAKHSVVIDRNSKTVLYGKQEYEKCKMASTTKIMTAIVVIENCNLSDKVKISSNSASTGGSRLGLAKNDEITVEHLLYGLMLRSGNDAAVALAEYAGGTVDEFINMMNKKASDLSLSSTHFVTPHGLDDEEHYTTAYELACLTDYALRNDIFAKIVNTKSFTININSNPKTLTNTNELLGSFEGVYGVKTGFTNGANRCLVTACKRNNIDVICVVLGCDTKRLRTSDSVKLLNYTLKNFITVNVKDIIEKEFEKWYILHSNSFSINKGKSQLMELYFAENELPYEKLTINKENVNKIENEILYNQNLSSPISENSIIGTLNFKVSNKEYFTINIKNSNEIKKKDIYDYLNIMFKNYFEYLMQK